jgi:hypothetical protein
MKARETNAEPTRLTWDNINAILRNGGPDEGFSTSEIAESLGATYVETGALLRLMFAAGGVARVRTGKNAGTTMYFYVGG